MFLQVTGILQVGFTILLLCIRQSPWGTVPWELLGTALAQLHAVQHLYPEFFQKCRACLHTHSFCITHMVWCLWHCISQNLVNWYDNLEKGSINLVKYHYAGTSLAKRRKGHFSVGMLWKKMVWHLSLKAIQKLSTDYPPTDISYFILSWMTVKQVKNTL